MHALIDSLELYGLGASWGGFESLVIPTELDKLRTAVPWRPPGPVFRVHAGLEAPEDLIADMARGFEHLRAAL
jgi:cystathionine beta-lyase